MPVRDQQKMMNDLQRLLEKQDFKTEAEMKNFLESLTGKQIPSEAAHNLSAQEQAEDLVYDAIETEDFDEAMALVEAALELDEDCILAWEYLADDEEFYAIKKLYYQKGIQLGEKQFDKSYEKENRGHYWMIHETRPYMRCLQKYSHLLHQYESEEASIEIGTRLLKLNPNDNQGVRYLLMLQLISTGRVEEYLKLYKKFKGEPFAFVQFTHALYLFKTSGASEEANAQLAVAKKSNKHVVKLLTANNKKRKESSGYSPGQDSEAYSYIDMAYETWQGTEGTVEWLKKSK